MRRLALLAAVPLIGLLLAVPVHASTPSGTLTLDNAPSFGGTAVFSASYSGLPKNSIPSMGVQCWQSGQSVYLQAQTQNGPIQPWTSFSMWSQTWANNGGGGANCVADLYYFTYQGKTVTGALGLAQITFTAAG